MPRTSAKRSSPRGAAAAVTPNSTTRSRRSTAAADDHDDDKASIKHELLTPLKKFATSKENLASTPSSISSLSPSSTKKLAVLDAQLGVSPYPKIARPTPAECEEVYRLLCEGHGVPERPKILEDRPDAAAGCGQVPSVLDALVRTTLSQNTTSRNSTAAKNAMDVVYGRANYRAVLEGGEDKLEETIRCGGLAKVKAKSIVKILKRLDEREGGQGKLSLDYLHQMSDQDAMKELCSFDLIGVKTASCVLLFCLGRDSFAVDTHVHRITMSLGWIPPTATRDAAFFHLDVRIPNHLKYGLHSLLVRHGRGCARCAAKGVTSMDYIAFCPIKELINKKGGGSAKKAAKKLAKEEGKDGVEFKVEDGKEVIKTKIEVMSDRKGLGVETTTITRPTRRAAQGPKIKDADSSTSEISSSEAEEEEEEAKPVVKRRRKVVKIERGVADDEREMSGIANGMDKSLRDDEVLLKAE